MQILYEDEWIVVPSLTEEEIAIVKKASTAAEEAAAQEPDGSLTPRLVGSRSRQHLGRFLGLRSFPVPHLPSLGATVAEVSPQRSLDWCVTC